MEPHDDPHTTLNAARLRSKDGCFILDFVLKSIIEREHRDWHTYEIHMIETGSWKRWSLTSSDDCCLFLDKVIDPEIPTLCRGLRHAVNTDEAYKFEPIDERDFVLEADSQEMGILVKMQYYHAPASAEFGWPTGQIVDGRELLRFANELESSFENLILGQT